VIENPTSNENSTNSGMKQMLWKELFCSGFAKGSRSTRGSKVTPKLDFGEGLGAVLELVGNLACKN
jgi:hypothetical protein